MIERQIEQLQSAGVEDIYIVISFMREKFFNLEAKYGVRLVSNNSFATKGNLLNLWKKKSKIWELQNFFGKNSMHDIRNN